jgi:hypothetical protein
MFARPVLVGMVKIDAPLGEAFLLADRAPHDSAARRLADARPVTCDQVFADVDQLAKELRGEYRQLQQRLA